MDKTWKLQRYDRKDYSELVDFPVEIVGRDGVVRRYAFEDSIRLYQRRITFAPVRYADPDLIRAEVNHCQSRIDQLRRSYFHRFGWGTPEGQRPAEEVFGTLCGEIAAFLCRALACEGRPDIRFDLLQSEGTLGEPGEVSTWYLTADSGAPAGMVLYVHRFPMPSLEPSPGPKPPVMKDPTREAFFQQVRGLERSGRAGGDTEKLLAFHHTVDCGFVLSGRAADFEAFVGARKEEPRVELAPTPWDEVLEIVRKGDYEAGLSRCRQLVTEQPYHRNAYVMGAMLANFLGDAVVGEDVAMLGSRYFPRDGAILYYLGLAQLRLDLPEEGHGSLQRAIDVAPELVAARIVLGVAHLQAGRSKDAERVLTVPSGVQPDDRRAAAELERLRQWMRWRRHMWAVGAALLAVSFLAAATVGMPGLLPGILGTGVIAGGWYAFHRQLEAVTARQHFEEISQGLRRLHRSDRDRLAS